MPRNTRFTSGVPDTTLINFDQYKYVQKLVNKYGVPTMSMSLSDLESFAKDIQREANRRFNTAATRPEMRETRAYKQFARQGLIALSKGFRYDQKGNRYLDTNLFNALTSPSVTPLAERRRKEYLIREIRRGVLYLNAQTSSVSGYRAWKNNSIAGVGQALVKLTNMTVNAMSQQYQSEMKAIARLQKRLAKEEKFNKKFWDIYHAFQAKYSRTEVNYIGSDVIIKTINVFMEQVPNYLVSDFIRMLEHVIYDQFTVEEAIDEIEKFRTQRKAARQGGNNDNDAGSGDTR